MHDPAKVPEPKNSAFFPNTNQGQNRPKQPVQRKQKKSVRILTLDYNILILSDESQSENTYIYMCPLIIKISSKEKILGTPS